MAAYDCKNEEVFNLGTSVRNAMIIGNISELYELWHEISNNVAI